MSTVLSQLLDWCPLSRLVFTGSIPVLHTNLWSQTSEADIWLSGYDHLTDLGGQRGGCQHLSQRKVVCFLLNKKKAHSGLIQVNDDGWMCCQFTTPGRSIKTQTIFAIEKISIFDRNNPIMNWGQKNLFFWKWYSNNSEFFGKLSP